MDWAEKYRPSSLEDVLGNTNAVRQIVEWARDWSPSRPPLLLHGKPGTGKTSAAHALAHDMGWTTLELNASDQRTRAVIEKVAGAGSTSRNLSGAVHTLIILDEADNLHGSADYGGARAILEVLRNARQPVILIVNDPYGLPGEIRSFCEPVQFRALPARSIAPALRHICSREAISCGDDAIRSIAEAAGGDMRSAVTMLHAAAVGKESVSGEDVRTSGKDQRSTIFSLVSAIHAGGKPEELLRIGREVEDTPDTIIQWIEASLPHMGRGGRAGRAYRWLARADCFLGNTFRLQHYTLWRYAQAMMVLGVSAEAEGCGIHARILPPDRWKRMSSGKRQRSLRTQAMTRIAQRNALAVRTLRETYLGPLTLLVDLAPEEFARDYGMNADELDLFIHDRDRAASACRSVQPALPDAPAGRKRGPRKRSAPATSAKDGVSPVPPGGHVSQAASGMSAKDGVSPVPPGGHVSGAVSAQGPVKGELTGEAPGTSEEKPKKGRQKTLFEGFTT